MVNTSMMLEEARFQFPAPAKKKNSKIRARMCRKLGKEK